MNCKHEYGHRVDQASRRVRLSISIDPDLLAWARSHRVDDTESFAREAIDVMAVCRRIAAQFGGEEAQDRA